jgi:dolichol-phosphate mannosyltransferase
VSDLPPDLSIVIPVFNEAEYIEQVLERVMALDAPKEVIVVDDGSTDGTLDKLTELATRWPSPALRVLSLGANHGKGRAIRHGIEHASGRVIAIQDADFEYDPAELPMLAAPILAGEERVVYGSRFRGEIRNMAPMNRLANRILSLAATVLYLHRVTDEATCYKLFAADVLKGIPLECERFEFCPEVTAKVLRRRIRIREIPIHYVGRTTLEGKKIRWFDGVVALWTLVRYRFSRRY